MSLDMLPTLSLERGRPQILPPPDRVLETAHQQCSRVGQTDPESGRDREFLAVKKEGKARLQAWELT